MTTPTELLEAAEQALAALADVDRRSGPDGATTWARAGHVFAVLRPEGIAIRVGGTIAAAASRTPDARLGDEGPDWVAFSPATLDGHAIDRLRAWLEAAHRRAT